MPKVARGGLHEDLRGGKGGRRGAKIESMKRMGSPASEEGSFQTYRTMSSTSGRNRFDRRDEELEQRNKELERLRRLVKDLELQARGRHQRRDHKERRERSASVEDHHGIGSHQSGSHRHQDRSREYANQDSISLKERQPLNAAMDAMSRALCRAARSPSRGTLRRYKCGAELHGRHLILTMER